MCRPLGPDTIGVPNTGYDGRPAPTSRKPLTTGDHWLCWLPNLWSFAADPPLQTTQRSDSQSLASAWLHHELGGVAFNSADVMRS